MSLIGLVDLVVMVDLVDDRPIQSKEDREELERRSRSRSERASVAFRAKIILLRAAGLSKLEVAEKLDTSEPTVQKWTGRYQGQGLAGIGYGDAAPALKEATKREAYL